MLYKKMEKAMITRNKDVSPYTEKRTSNRSLLIRTIGLLMLLVPILLLFTTEPVILLICLIVAGIIAFILAYRLS